MSRVWWIPLLPLSAVLLMAVDQPWKDKQESQWTDQDTKLILSDSPWSRHVKPVVQPRQTRQSQQQQPRRAGTGRNNGGVFGIPGIGGGRQRYPGGGYPGGGYPGGGYPGGGYPGGGSPGGGNPGGGSDPTAGRRGGSSNADSAAAIEPPELTLRWESARPVRDAELKSRDTQAPSIEEQKYAIAVYGVPNNLAPGESQTVLNKLKSQAVIKRDGKKDLKPSKVVVLDRESGPVYVFLFNRSMKKPEITDKDKRVEFDAQIGRLKFSDSFFLEDMVYQGKLEI